MKAAEAYAPWTDDSEAQAIAAEHARRQRMHDEWVEFMSTHAERQRKAHRAFWAITMLCVFLWIGLVGLWAGAE